MLEELFDLFADRGGHFRYEPGHLGDLWLECLADRSSRLREPSACPLCASGLRIEGFAEGCQGGD
jgi:hypothetical protein